jgi:hypothetical protein
MFIQHQGVKRHLNNTLLPDILCLGIPGKISRNDEYSCPADHLNPYRPAKILYWKTEDKILIVGRD